MKPYSKALTLRLVFADISRISLRPVAGVEQGGLVLRAPSSASIVVGLLKSQRDSLSLCHEMGLFQKIFSCPLGVVSMKKNGKKMYGGQKEINLWFPKNITAIAN